MEAPSISLIVIFLAAAFPAAACCAPSTPAEVRDAPAAREPDLLLLPGKSAREAGLPDAGHGPVSGTLFGRHAEGRAYSGLKGGRRIITRMDLFSDISWEECHAALRALYDVPYETLFIPHTYTDGSGKAASFFTGRGTVSIRQSTKSRFLEISFTDRVPGKEHIPVLPVTLQALNEHMGMELSFDKSPFSPVRLHRIRHGGDPIFRIICRDKRDREFRLYLQKRQTNIVPCQFDPDITWKTEWEHRHFRVDPLDSSGRILTFLQYDEGGAGCAVLFKGGNFGILMRSGASRAGLEAALDDLIKILSAAGRSAAPEGHGQATTDGARR